MMDLQGFEKKLRESGNAEKLMAAAQSAEGQRLQQMLDADKIQSAARSGDAQAIKNILSQVLSTPEGKRLAEKVQKAMEQK